MNEDFEKYIKEKRKLPRKIKKEIKSWFINTFPNYPKELLKSKIINLDRYMLGIYYECKYERIYKMLN